LRRSKILSPYHFQFIAVSPFQFLKIDKEIKQ
jgi:hypothetical protein